MPEHDLPATEHEPTPLLRPREGTPTPITDGAGLTEFARRLTSGSGPIALDTERASGFRYSQRAFLVQIRRAGAGTALIDPIAIPDLEALVPALASAEWVLHAASQDLPCLAELGLRPPTLFDTELAGRLAGLPRVGLGPLVEQMLGLHLAKGHGADDWSKRPLPTAWLDYAALDVEVLTELRDVMADLLAQQGKSDWAAQEFEAVRTAGPAEPRQDPWRRTAGIHTVSDRRVLATIRELWFARDELARHRDLAPHRVLPDSAIVAAATTAPKSIAELTALPVFSGRNQQRQARRWFAAIERARELPAAQLPPKRLPADGPPSPNRWAHKDPDAAQRLAYARTHLAELSEAVNVPVENLASPRTVRQILWEGPADEEVGVRLKAAGARPWQVELVTPIMADALLAKA